MTQPTVRTIIFATDRELKWESSDGDTHHVTFLPGDPYLHGEFRVVLPTGDVDIDQLYIDDVLSDIVPSELALDEKVFLSLKHNIKFISEY